MTTRDDIAAAVTMTVDADGTPWSVVGYITQPATPVSGDAWPVWVSSLWRNGCVIEREWRVIVVLPAGTPEVWAVHRDAVDEQVGATLYDKGCGMVDRSEPVQVLLAENAPVPAVQLSFTA